MSIKNTLLDGLDFEVGTAVPAVDLNDTFDAAATIIKRKIHTDATERTHTGDTNWADAGSPFTITDGLNALIIGINFKCEIKTSNAVNLADATLKITGSNLGSKYLISKPFAVWTADSDTFEGGLSDSEADLFTTNNTNYNTHHLSAFIPLKLLDATTTFQVRIAIDGAGETVSIDEVIIEIVYVSNFSEE